MKHVRQFDGNCNKGIDKKYENENEKKKKTTTTVCMR